MTVERRTTNQYENVGLWWLPTGVYQVDAA
jgi:hypothetical protein